MRKGASIRIDSNHPICSGLCNFLLDSNLLNSSYWFPVAEQVVSCLYSLAEHPDRLTGDLIKKFASLALDTKEK